jgi:hypothetical protein
MRSRRSVLATIATCMIATLFLALAPAASAASKASDLKVARTGVLVTSDFPAGWSGSRNPSASDAAAIKAGKKIPSCSDFVKLRTLTAPLPQARSLAFDGGSGVTASNTVDAFSSTARAKASMTLWSSTKMPTCLEKYTQKAAGSDVTITVDTADLSSLSSDAVGYTAKVADANGTTREVLLSFAVPVGRYVSVYTVDVTGADAVLDPVDAAVQSSLTRLATAVNS